jgi:hypothetical protein
MRAPAAPHAESHDRVHILWRRVPTSEGLSLILWEAVTACLDGRCRMTSCANPPAHSFLLDALDIDANVSARAARCCTSQRTSRPERLGASPRVRQRSVRNVTEYRSCATAGM